MNKPLNDSFQTLFRQWRNSRHFSQLDLALEADISQRHISYLETGRSRPSRDMILHLSEVLEIPLRERNTLLKAAGFSAEYTETELEAPKMKPIREAVARILDHHTPYPAMAVDRLWNIVQTNSAADRMLEAAKSQLNPADFSSEELNYLGNIAFLTVHPKAFRSLIKNWEVSGPQFVHRLKRDKAALGNSPSAPFYDMLIEAADLDERVGAPQEDLLPFIPLEFTLAGFDLSVFSVISTFGTPQDITTDELRIEAFYPTNDQTEAFFGQ
ncbi:helix-turn-helix domain-containing protein [Sneathiella sp. P13V-1]|uniref:helix-turn-helix domain-containing protein n=1 Tax=Sneathiella sp. P13V-1 TaxID=2697366 RepID=UPI00187B257E|nr:helix-turn-helix transcriptional regulator [Sneathiella sp. P13V-1]MBE7635305.1 helix-turn-helix domain-containing protein [Sneathiella sp. P13V-1]